VRAVIADDSVLLREGITLLLAQDGIDVVASAGDAEALIRAVQTQQPDLAVIDVRMPPGHQDEGLRAAIEIRRRWPAIALLVLSQFVEERYASELLAADTRAIGYLLKDRVADVAEFIEAVRRVASGGTALDPEVVRQLLARSRQADQLGPADKPRAGRARADGRGAVEHRDRRDAHSLDRHRREARRRHLHEARPPRRRRSI
jgi:DNA-binding NarL/FixJ family response regulator